MHVCVSMHECLFACMYACFVECMKVSFPKFHHQFCSLGIFLFKRKIDFFPAFVFHFKHFFFYFTSDTYSLDSFTCVP